MDKSSENSPSMALRPFRLDELPAPQDLVEPQVADVELELRVELGRSQMDISQVMRLRHGSVVPLAEAVAEPVDVYANEQLVARGEVLVLNETFCVRITELLGDSQQAAG